MRSRRTALPLLLCLVTALGVSAGQAATAQAGRDADAVVDPKLYDGLAYRSLEFTRGGRATAVAGVAGEPLVYYFGATGGGVWKTTDAGLTWRNVSDGFFGVGSIGAIAVAPSDPNVVYVGTGSACPRGNISVGDGLYRSTDGGKSWSKQLSLVGQVGKIAVHPHDPDTAWAAVLGNIFGPSRERGVYRTTDGGATWQKVLYVDEDTGAVDIEVDPNNPRILLASVWTAERKPWTIDSGSAQDGVYRSRDGGATWQKLAGGLPTGIVGKTSVAISPANGERMWVLAEADGDQGGVYRSDDGGDHWRRVNKERKLLQRAWYYIHIYADPQDADTVYALNTGFYKSTDGGRTFDTQIRVPHGDNHDLWINPDDPRIMIESNDGGANVSFTGGEAWTHQRNQPTAQIYRVTVDGRHPYRVYGAQQDNSTVRLSSRPGGGFGGGGFGADFDSVGGGESGHIAVDPRTDEVVYAGSYGGTITRRDMLTGLTENVRAYPESQTGQQALDMKYRFQWNAPIRISPHDPEIVYHTSQYVHRTRDGGRTWEVISPDLTTNDPETQGYSGKPITRDNTGVEVFNTIFAFEESPLVRGLLWAGTDDGRVWVSRDDGGNWSEITPPGMPARGTVNTIDVSAHAPGRIHIAVHRYRENDFRPYIFRTDDYGAHWQLLTDGNNGIPADHWVRVVREDPDRRGLLYAGTEFGMYVSFDDGAHWQSLQLNLPVTPVTDLQIHRGDLVVATQGRGFWILDDMTPLRQLTDEVTSARAWLFSPRKAYRAGNLGPARIDFYFEQEPEGEVTLQVLNSAGEVVFETKGRAGDKGPQQPQQGFFASLFGGRGARLSVKKGFNRFAWNLREKGPEIPADVTLWGFAPGRQVPPGSYTVRLSAGDWSQERTLEVDINPKSGVTEEDLRLQYELLGKIGARIDELYDGLRTLRDVKKQAADAVARLKKAGVAADDVAAAQKALDDKLSAIEQKLTQVKSKSSQDPINFPPMLDNQFVTLYGYVLGGFGGSDNRPTDGAYERLADLEPQLQELLGQLDGVLATDLPAFNELVAAKKIPAVVVKREGQEGEQQ